MGQDMSLPSFPHVSGGAAALAARHAAQGWPGFLTGRAMQAQASKFRVRRSVLGRRVRLVDRAEGCIEYARLAVPGTGAVFYQRVDAPCGRGGGLPKFPHALVAHELPGGEGTPYAATVQRPNYAELADTRTGRCATYRRSARDGTWVKVEERCRETRHVAEVSRQRVELDR